MSWLSAKAQLLRKLRVRAGVAQLLSIVIDPFEFRSTTDGNWQQLEQLESVVEFYVNFRPPGPSATNPELWGDPWAQGAELLSSSDARYVKPNFGIIKGAAATWVSGSTVKLDSDFDLNEVIVNPPNIDPPAAGHQYGNPKVAGATPADYPQRRAFLYDMLELYEGTRISKLYRIMEVDDEAKSVTLDVDPGLGTKKSGWKIVRRPILVVIDPLGARQNNLGGATWSGVAAHVMGVDSTNRNWTVVELDAGGPSLNRVNTHFDTIYFVNTELSDRESHAYRIMAVKSMTENEAAQPVADRPAAATLNRRISVDGRPVFPAAGSQWNLPAGLSGVHSPLAYNILQSQTDAVRKTRGNDHYDGALFIVYDGKILHRFRWTSYSSRAWGPWNVDPPTEGDWRDYQSSLRGNGRYYYSSYLSEKDAINYAFAVIEAKRLSGVPCFRPLPRHRIAMGSDNTFKRPDDPDRPWDLTPRARYYPGSPPSPPAPDDNGSLRADVVKYDSDGKKNIRLHRGQSVQSGTTTGATASTGSAGCLVSPEFHAMRKELIRIYEEEYERFYGPGEQDDKIHQVFDCANHDAAVALSNGPNVPRQYWDDKFAGFLWLIRPDERPAT